MATCLSNQNNTCSCKPNLESLVHQSKEQLEDNHYDDIWAIDNDYDDGQESIPRRRQEQLAYNDVIRQHRKQGYIDGITAHREDQLQRGFDDAFPKGAELGVEVGKILARLRCKQGRKARVGETRGGNNGDNGDDNDDNDDDEFKRAINDLSISKVLDRQYFNDELNPLLTHELIAKWKKQD